MTGETTKLNETRIRQLRAKGWSDQGIARHLSLPLSIVRDVIRNL
jgi:hypothetical protein